MLRIIRKIRKWIRLLGWDVVRYHCDSSPHPDLLQFIAPAYANAIEDFTVLQIGAYDGEMGDPICSLIRHYKWRSILVEPIPEAYHRLKNYYAGFANVECVNSAIDWADGSRTLYRIRGKDLPDWAYGVASFSLKHVQREIKHKSLKNATIEQLTVPTHTIKWICTHYNISRVALLQVDVEGYDWEILQMTFREKIFPDIVHFEHCHIPFADRMKCFGYLSSIGYRYVNLGMNTLALRDIGKTISEA